MLPATALGRVAVTGASGFIGQTFVPVLVRAGWCVRALVRRPEPALAAVGVETTPGSLEDAESLKRLVDGACAIVHAAGAITARTPEDFFTINADGTARLVEAAAQASKPPRVLLISSLAAREPALSPYAASKRQAEKVLAQSGSGLEHSILRPPAVYGPGDRATLPLFRQLARGFVAVPAVAEARFSLLHVEDLATAIAHLLNYPIWDGSVLELDDGHTGGYSWPAIVEIAGRHLGKRVRCLAVPRWAAWLPGLASEIAGRAFGRAPMLTLTKLRELYHADWVCRPAPASPLLDGWRPEMPFEEGFPKTLRWYKQKGWL